MGIQILGSSAPSVSSQNSISEAAAMSSDTKALTGLRGTAARDPKAAIKEAAKQFESLFMQELMKSMRKATQSSGLMDNAGTQMGTDMLDDQFALKMSGQPGGLGSVIERQLQRQMGATLENKSGLQSKPVAALPAAAPAVSASMTVKERQLDFVQRNTASARAAEAQTGIPASFMVAQAAHESGWGRRDIRNADGSSSNNLFGIKAGANWTGPVAEVMTTEYVGGKAHKVMAKFRSYESADASFRDYAKLMKDSPRYAGVVAGVAKPAVPKVSEGIQLAAYNPALSHNSAHNSAHTSASTSDANAAKFARGLQRAGYATDPAYADKLTRVINTTLRLQRVVT
jgi:peptidoglycan hydrolase FlgJ